MIQAVNHVGVILLGFFTQVNEQTRFATTGHLLIPCIMAWLSVTLKDSAYRWFSFVLGILYAVIKLLYLTTSSTSGAPAFRFNELWGLAAALLIIWYAWKRPKQGA